MAWNGSDANTTLCAKKEKNPVGIRREHHAYIKAFATGLIIVFVCGIIAIFGLSKASKVPIEQVGRPSRIAEQRQQITRKTVGSCASKIINRRAAEIAREYSDQVNNLIRAKTNDISWISKPIDSDDPDIALRARVTQELGSLLSIEPGEPMPPFPYSFILEDHMRMAAERGEDVETIDNGNAAFMESVKKYKIVAKETDDENRLAHKQKLLEAQGELLSGLDQGLSVNDSIRAAYEFRMRAYETRRAAIDTMTEFLAKGDDVEDTKGVLKQINKQFAEQGIKQVSAEEIGLEIPDEEKEGEIIQ